MKVLLVEDDAAIAGEIQSALGREGYAVDIASEGFDGLTQAQEAPYALIILDVMLPGVTGWEICERLRKDGISTPILMLTARDSVDDRVRGLEGGADDYLAKPFDIRELAARMRALLRREQVHRTGVIQVADLILDTKARSVQRGNTPIRLTPREYSLLEALARNEGRTLTREMILEGVWANEESLENTVNFHVTSLRRKVDAGFEPKLIHTVHGIGYVLRAGGA